MEEREPDLSSERLFDSSRVFPLRALDSSCALSSWVVGELGSLFESPEGDLEAGVDDGNTALAERRLALGGMMTLWNGNLVFANISGTSRDLDTLNTELNFSTLHCFTFLTLISLVLEPNPSLVLSLAIACQQMS